MCNNLKCFQTGLPILQSSSIPPTSNNFWTLQREDQRAAQGPFCRLQHYAIYALVILSCFSFNRSITAATSNGALTPCWHLLRATKPCSSGCENGMGVLSRGGMWLPVSQGGSACVQDLTKYLMKIVVGFRLIPCSQIKV